MLQPRQPSLLPIYLALAIALVATLGVVYFYFKTPTPSANITNFSQAREVQAFTLSSKPAFTERQLIDHWTLLFFGYTHCSDVCPASLEKLNKIYSKLHPKHPNLQIVFVSIDPEQDKPETVARYAESFNKNFIGLSGTPEEVEALKKEFGIFAQKDENQKLNHNSSVILINPLAQWQALLGANLSVTDFIHEFTQVVRDSPYA